MASMDALSESAEMMIKNINELASNNERVRTSDLSAKTELKPASVTEMIQRLGEIGLVDYEPYHGVHLQGLVRDNAPMHLGRYWMYHPDKTSRFPFCES